MDLRRFSRVVFICIVSIIIGIIHFNATKKFTPFKGVQQTSYMYVTVNI